LYFSGPLKGSAWSLWCNHLENFIDYRVIHIAEARDRPGPTDVDRAINYQFVINVNADYATEGNVIAEPVRRLTCLGQ
jgi:hypothetical protein